MTENTNKENTVSEATAADGAAAKTETAAGADGTRGRGGRDGARGGREGGRDGGRGRGRDGGREAEKFRPLSPRVLKKQRRRCSAFR